MKLYNKKNDEKSYSVIFDIGSGSIGTAVVGSEKDSSPILYYTSRLELKLQEDFSLDKFKEHLLHSLDEERVKLEDKILKHLPRKIEHVLCILSSPWYIYQTKTLRFEQEEPIEVSRSFVKKIIKEFRSEFRKSQELKIVQQKIGSPEIIEEHILGTLLNGYPTSNPYGKKVTRLEIALFLSMMSEQMRSSVRAVLRKSFNVHDIIFHSSVLTVFSAVRNIFSGDSNFLLVNVTGEVTDISLVLDGALMETMSFPVGVNTIVRNLSASLNTSSSAALSLLNMGTAGATDSSGQNESSGSVTSSKESWLAPFRTSLSTLSEKKAVPPKIFLITDREVGGWFKEMVESDDFKFGLSVSKMNSIILINDLLLAKHFILGKRVVPDVMLALATLFDSHPVNSL